MSAWTVRSIWVGPPLGALQWACLTSFVMHGARFELYTDDLARRVPAGVVRRDARELLGDRVYRYGPRAGAHAGSYALSGDIARLHALYRHGGWWVDMDVICLRPFASLADRFTLGWEDPWLAAVGVMHTEAWDPIVGLLLRRALEPWLGSPWDPWPIRLRNMVRLRGTLRDPCDVWFGASAGPRPTTAALRHYRLTRFILPREAFYPIPWQHALHIPQMSHADFHQLATRTYAVHVWAERLRLAHGRAAGIADAPWIAPYLDGFARDGGLHAGAGAAPS